jgi:hypothetical protein
VSLAVICTKTDKGRAEIAARSDALSPLERRVLILVDGRKSVGDLGAFVRVGDLDGALAHLLALGMVTSTNEVSTQQAPRPATSLAHFNEVREQASTFVRESLGASGEPIWAAIDRSNSPEELRKLLRGIEIFVGQRLSAETTQAFARRFGALLL